MSIRSKLNKELHGMEAAGVIEKVEVPINWIKALVIIENLDDSLRLCVHPRDFNKFRKKEHLPLTTTYI